MIDQKGSWDKLGRILFADPAIWWMEEFTGPSYVLNVEDQSLRLFVTGRDKKNRSFIGLCDFKINGDQDVYIRPSPEPVMSLGELGTFDENGVSYPNMYKADNKIYMNYVGWMPTVLTPFQNHTGLAYSENGGLSFERYSRAPILERTNEEPFGTGSSFVINKNDKFLMYYTSFDRWGKPNEHKHYYNIKLAESEDGVNWNRTGKVCVTYCSDDEYAISRPSVLLHNDTYHMWFCVRGDQYKIGYAWSKDGVSWVRNDNLVNISHGPELWDNKAMSYPHVFVHNAQIYMIYCGNEYGKFGLGLAKWINN